VKGRLDQLIIRPSVRYLEGYRDLETAQGDGAIAATGANPRTSQSTKHDERIFNAELLERIQLVSIARLSLPPF
jgi:hypothetical protein